MDGYARTEDELFSSCLLNLTWENCYEQVGHDSVQRTGVNYGKKKTNNNNKLMLSVTNML